MSLTIRIALGLIKDHRGKVILFEFAVNRNAIPFSEWHEKGLIGKPIPQDVKWSEFKGFLTTVLRKADTIHVNLDGVEERLGASPMRLSTILLDEPAGGEAWLRSELKVITDAFCDKTTFYQAGSVVDTDIC